MAERRMIRKDLWDDDAFNQLTITTRLLYLGIIIHADDEGCFKAQPKYLKRKILYSDRMGPEKIQIMLDSLHDSNFIVLGQSRFAGLGYLPSWRQMQTFPNHPGKPSEYTDFLVDLKVTPRWSMVTQDNVIEEKISEKKERKNNIYQGREKMISAMGNLSSFLEDIPE